MNKIAIIRLATHLRYTCEKERKTTLLREIHSKQGRTLCVTIKMLKGYREIHSSAREKALALQVNYHFNSLLERIGIGSIPIRSSLHHTA